MAGHQGLTLLVFCSFLLIVLAKLEATSPSSPIPPCTTGWSKPYSSHSPDEEGDYESVYDIQEEFNVCAEGKVTDVQCLAWVDDRWVDHNDLQTKLKVVCNIDGVSCEGDCYDVGISLYCQCATTESTTLTSTTWRASEATTQSTTLTPSSKPTSTSEATSPSSSFPPCTNGWSDIYNTRPPQSDGEHEGVIKLQETLGVCFGGTIQDIRCFALVNGSWVNYTEVNENAECTVYFGLVCLFPCHDYGISVYCQCDTTQSTTPPPPTRLASTSEATTQSTTPSPTTWRTSKATSPSSPIPPCTSEWSPVYSSHKPDEAGDHEYIYDIIDIFNVCPKGKVTDIKCFALVNGTWVDSINVKQQFFDCNLDDGVTCGGNTCHDYGISLYCECATTQSTTLTPASWPTSTSEATSPSSSTPPCTTEWSPIYKAKKTSRGSVSQSIGLLPQEKNFCINGKITDVKCFAFVNGDWVDYKEPGENVACTLEKLRCYKRNSECHDYGSSLYCECDTTQSTTLTPASWPTSRSEEKCATKKIPLEKTVHYFRFKDEEKGECSNDQPIQYLTECFGQCNSQTKYSLSLKAYTSTSNCCYPRNSVTQSISLHCEDNSSIVMEYKQPNSCECVSSEGE